MLAIWLGRRFSRQHHDKRTQRAPRSSTDRLVDRLAARLARRTGSQRVRALRANLAVVYGLDPSDKALDHRVTENLVCALRGHLDFIRAIISDPRQACTLDADSLSVVEDLQRQGRGVLLVGAHTAGFDLLMVRISQHFAGVQALTMLHPRFETRLVNRLRSRWGMRITPIDPANLRSAMRRLRRGGIVAIAADVPTPGGPTLRFFGRPCQLGNGHTRLALATGAAIVVACSRRRGPRQLEGWGVLCQAPEASGDLRGDAQAWAQRVIEVLEHQISQRPWEWYMPVPLWPEGNPDPTAQSGLVMHGESVVC